MAIDLRNPQGEFGGSFQAAADILTSIQRANKAKANRQQLNEISKARTLNPNASIDEILAGLPQRESATGVAGFIDRITGKGQGDIIPELQARSLTQPRKTTTLSAEEQAKAERIREGLLARATASTTTEPFKKTPEEIQRDRDIKFLDDGKGKPFQLREAEDRLRALPAGNLIQVEPSKENDKIFAKLTRSFIGEIKPTATRTTAKGRTDKVFGQADFETLVAESVKEGLKDGVDPASMEATVLEWWNRQFEKEKDQEFQKFQKIEQDPTQIIAQAAQEGLLSEEDVQSITAGLQADPSKLQDVLDLIERKRSGK